jgi:hypothetical protein
MGATTSNNSCRLIVFAPTPQWISGFSVYQNSTSSTSTRAEQHQHQSRAAPAPEQSSTSTRAQQHQHSTSAAPAQLMGKCSKCQEKPASYCDPADGLGRYCKQYASTVSSMVSR